MKSFMGEYGRIVAVAVVVGILFVYIFATGSDGFLGKITSMRLNETVSYENNADHLVSDTKRLEELKNVVKETTIKIPKLKNGHGYDLLAYVPPMEMEDGTKISKKVLTVTYQKSSVNGEEIVISTNDPILDLTKDGKSGIYHVTYEFADGDLKTEKTIVFIVN